MTTQTRIQKVIQAAGLASRREAESLIREGLVRVNGAIVTQMGMKVDRKKDAIKVKGKLITTQLIQPKIYLAFYKPRGVICTHEDPQQRETMWDFIPPVFRHKGLSAAGRLDLQTEGLIILSNDGEFIERCSHPRYRIEKVYAAKVRGIPSEKALAKFQKGMTIDDQRTLPCKAKRIYRPETKHTWCEVILHEGRKNQIRKMFYAIGHGVIKLKRIRVGAVALGTLQPGQLRGLTKTEIQKLLTNQKIKAY